MWHYGERQRTGKDYIPIKQALLQRFLDRGE
jgi:hypothetical protein